MRNFSLLLLLSSSSPLLVKQTLSLSLLSSSFYNHNLLIRNRFKHHHNTIPMMEYSTNIPTTITSSNAVTTTTSILDKNSFNKTISLIALNIPSKLCSIYLNTFAKYTLSLPKTKRIIHIDNNNERRLVLLSDTLSASLLSLSNNHIENIHEHLPDDLKYYNAENGATIELYKFEIGYDNLAVDEVLRKILPDSIKEIPSSFEQAGHLAHLNLREEALPFKQVIGQVIIDKNPHIKTVINKVGNIETEFRTFPIELLAGENNFHVSLKESNAKFQFDFDKVYWNSRLQMEHSRVISLIKGSCKKENIDINNKKDKHNSNLVPRDRIVADMMAGIGPFAVPLAKERVKVYANDLNPESYKYLVSNTKLNQCENFLESFNLDGRMFILELIEREIKFNEVLMNLPQSATDFLDVFIGLGQRIGPSFNESLLPRIHVYAFSTASDPVADIVDRVAGVMKCDPSALNFNGSDNIPKNMEESLSFPCWGHIVRDVSPKKMMICLSFRLPLSVALADPIVHVVEENAKKKIRIN